MTEKRTILHAVWLLAEHVTYEVGVNARQIWLMADGNGLSGYYDRIHVYDNDGKHRVIPAHCADMWEEIEQ